MLIADTSGLLTQFERDAGLAVRVRRAIVNEGEAPVLPAPVAAELDYMITVRAGIRASHQFLRDLSLGRFVVPCLEPADYQTIQALAQQYQDLRLGLVDLSIVVLAARYRTKRILTFDSHFRVVRPLQGGVFTLLPDDEPGLAIRT